MVVPCRDACSVTNVVGRPVLRRALRVCFEREPRARRIAGRLHDRSGRRPAAAAGAAATAGAAPAADRFRSASDARRPPADRLSRRAIRVQWCLRRSAIDGFQLWCLRQCVHRRNRLPDGRVRDGLYARHDAVRRRLRRCLDQRATLRGLRQRLRDGRDVYGWPMRVPDGRHALRRCVCRSAERPA